MASALFRSVRVPVVLALTLPLVLHAAPLTASTDSREPWIIAHRGASGSAPENTIAAFGRALRLGATMLEADVRLTGPDRRGRRVPVAFHDATLGRTTDCHGHVRETTWRRLRRCDAGFGAPEHLHPRWTGEGVRVPTVARLLRAFPRVPVILDVKARADRPDDAADVAATVEALVRVLRARHAAGDRVFSRVIVASFGRDTLTLARSLEPRIRTALVTKHPEPYLMTVIRSVAAGDAAAIPSVRAHDLNQLTARLVRDAGHPVFVHTADRPSRIRAMLELGVEGIYTNHPDAVVRVLRQPPRSARACDTSICI